MVLVVDRLHTIDTLQTEVAFLDGVIEGFIRRIDGVGNGARNIVLDSVTELLVGRQFLQTNGRSKLHLVVVLVQRTEHTAKVAHIGIVYSLLITTGNGVEWYNRDDLIVAVIGE